MKHQLVIVLDFGGQYNLLIARRVREQGVYAEVLPYTTDLETIRSKQPIGIIFTGGPNSVYAADSPLCGKELLELGVPILGICYGSQLIAHVMGGTVSAAPQREYGKTQVKLGESPLFAGMEAETTCWMSHTDYVQQIPEGFEITASTDNCPAAAFENQDKQLYAVQFHPEVDHTPRGKDMLHNFLFHITGKNWR